MAYPVYTICTNRTFDYVFVGVYCVTIKACYVTVHRHIINDSIVSTRGRKDICRVEEDE